MFYHLLFPLKQYISFLNIFKYITFRSACASITAFIFCLIVGPWLIRRLTRMSVVTNTKRDHASSIHQFYKDKGQIPSMGGLLIVGSALVSCLLWGNFHNAFFNLALVILVAFTCIGFMDDWVKLRSKSTKGITARMKFSGQLLVGIILGIYLYFEPRVDEYLYVPFFKDFRFDLGIFYILFVVLVLTGTSNAVNLTDGLDGLATGCFIIACGVFGLIAYIVGRVDYADYLGIPFIDYAGELAVYCAALVGASVGFLWYNSYPAQVFMGDTGSISLGSALAVVAIMIKKELILMVVGGVFVWEAVSVILQVASFKMFKKRIFRMSPFHHHLQLIGWPESKVTIRLWIIAFILALVGLGMLKLQ